MKSGFGFADYLLYLDRKAVGAVEAKSEGTLSGVEAQSAKYAAGLPDNLPISSRHSKLLLMKSSEGSAYLPKVFVRLIVCAATAFNRLTCRWRVPR